MEEMSASSQEITNSLLQINGSVEASLQKVEEISTVARKNTSESEKIITVTEDVYNSAIKNKEDVSEIAAQTNLLALT